MAQCAHRPPAKSELSPLKMPVPGGRARWLHALKRAVGPKAGYKKLSFLVIIHIFDVAYLNALGRDSGGCGRALRARPHPPFPPFSHMRIIASLICLDRGNVLT